jgi:hypothetical protein
VDLVALDGTRFSLSIAGYQSLGNTGSGPGDWDANWLNVAGELHLPDGRRHSFLDPCLTTWEARELATWLAAVVAGNASPAEDQSLPAITFTEPCVAFGLADGGSGPIGLRVYLSLEAEPPFVVAGQKGMFKNYVPLPTTEADVLRAAGELSSELSAYPVRA